MSKVPHMLQYSYITPHLKVLVKWRKYSNMWAKKLWTFLNCSVSLLWPHWLRVSVSVATSDVIMRVHEQSLSFHWISRVLLDCILVSLNIIARRVEVLGLWKMGFLCLLVWLLVFSEIEWIKKGSFWNLGKFPRKHSRCGQVIFFNSRLCRV